MKPRRCCFCYLQSFLLLVVVVAVPAIGAKRETGLVLRHGWYVCRGHIIWGYGQQNGWWRPGQRPNITRNAPGQIGPNRTEDLDQPEPRVRCATLGLVVSRLRRGGATPMQVKYRDLFMIALADDTAAADGDRKREARTRRMGGASPRRHTIRRATP